MRFQRDIVVRNEHFVPERDANLVDVLFGPFDEGEVVEFVDEVPDIFTLLVECEVFKSKSQARKNWKRGPIKPGWNDFPDIGKLHHHISVWVPQEFVVDHDGMVAAGRLTARVLAAVTAAVRPGVSPLELDEIAAEVIREDGGTPCFRDEGFPGCICVEVNDVVVHGEPTSGVVLREGDVVGIDAGVELKGLYGDAATTVVVGTVDEATQRLLATGRAALEAGVAAAQPGNTVGDVSRAVQTVAEGAGYSCVRNFVGHGIGYDLHCWPKVPNYYDPGDAGLDYDAVLRPGMFLAIEPMINEGSHEVVLGSGDWAYHTADGKRSVHFEHTVAITEGGPVVLTNMLLDSYADRE